MNNTKIENELQYKAIMQRIEELIQLTDDNTPKNDKNLIELDVLSGLIEEYEDAHFPISDPTEEDIQKLRIYEKRLIQNTNETLRNVSSSGYIPEPKTIQEFEHNAKFQFDNVSGWMSVKDYETALIKARYFIEALEDLVNYQRQSLINNT